MSSDRMTHQALYAIIRNHDRARNEEKRRAEKTCSDRVVPSVLIHTGLFATSGAILGSLGATVLGYSKHAVLEACRAGAAGNSIFGALMGLAAASWDGRELAGEIIAATAFNLVFSTAGAALGGSMLSDTQHISPEDAAAAVGTGEGVLVGGTICCVVSTIAALGYCRRRYLRNTRGNNHNAEAKADATQAAAPAQIEVVAPETTIGVITPPTTSIAIIERPTANPTVAAPQVVAESKFNVTPQTTGPQTPTVTEAKSTEEISSEDFVIQIKPR